MFWKNDDACLYLKPSTFYWERERQSQLIPELMYFCIHDDFISRIVLYYIKLV